MKITLLIISAASLIAFGGFAQADDHLFQATRHGLPLEKALTLHDAPGRGSPWTGFEEEDFGIPSTRTPQADPNDTKTNPAKPHCAGCENPALQ